MKKNVILCADDFGYNDAISASLIHLANTQKISAISCMTNMPAFISHAAQLANINHAIQLGWHVNFTEGRALHSPAQSQFAPVNTLLLRAYLRRLNKVLIRSELEAQLDCFIEHIGQAPDFIDGHQHIHQFPLIRDTLLELYRERFPGKRVWIRVSSNPFWRSLRESMNYPKVFIIMMTGALALKKRLCRCGIPHNKTFSGIYDLIGTENYAELFQRFVNLVDDRGLIMCHPADRSDDSIARARQNEFDFLVSRNCQEPPTV